MALSSATTPPGAFRGRWAIEAFSDKKTMAGLVSEGMKGDYSWDRSAPLYKELYESLSTP